MVQQDETRHRLSGVPLKAMKEASSVIRVPRERLGEAAGLLARCFSANPTFVDLFPDDSARSHALPHLFAAGLRDALGFCHVYAVTQGAGGSTGDELAVVALWLPPGAFPPSALAPPQMTVYSEIGIDRWLITGV